MPFLAALKQTVDQDVAAYCDRKVPLRVHDKVRLVHQWRGSRVSLIAVARPPYNKQIHLKKDPYQELGKEYFCKSPKIYF
jgi:hypothetical protein